MSSEMKQVVNNSSQLVCFFNRMSSDLLMSGFDFRMTNSGMN